MKLKQIRVDGFKNLINCVMDLEDFNVLVGPNNSGKSNLLEIFQLLGAICIGSESLRNMIFQGMTLTKRFSLWLSHLDKQLKQDLTIGICFETVYKKNRWIVDYEVAIEGDLGTKKKGGVLKETLKAKQASKRGPFVTYIARKGKTLQVGRQKKEISLRNSAFNAITSLYPDYKGLPVELEVIIDDISSLLFCPIFSMWPEGLRASINQADAEIGSRNISSFDPIKVIDKVREESPERFELFKGTLCDIFDLEDITFISKTIAIEEGENNGKRFRYCSAKRRGSKAGYISEFSDGTFAVFGVLAALMSQDEDSPIFCLEEPENCLHPAALEKLLRFFQDNSDRWPVLITTHSPYLLNGVRPEDVRVAVVGDDGATHIESVKNKRELRDYLNKGMMSFGDLLVNNFDDFRE